MDSTTRDPETTLKQVQGDGRCGVQDDEGCGVQDDGGNKTARRNSTTCSVSSCLLHSLTALRTSNSKVRFVLVTKQSLTYSY